MAKRFKRYAQLPREPTRGLIEGTWPRVTRSRRPYFPENQLGASLKVTFQKEAKTESLILPREPTRGLIEG